MITMGTDPNGRTQVFNHGGHVTYIGRDIAHHSLYPSDYTPQPVTQRRLFREYVRDCAADVRDHKAFWLCTSLVFGYLLYHVIAFAVSMPWAMRIGQ